MTKLRITEIPDEKPVRLTIELPADIHRDLLAYAAMVRQNGKSVEPARLIPHMLRSFIDSDRVFQKRKREETQRVVMAPLSAVPEK